MEPNNYERFSEQLSDFVPTDDNKTDDDDDTCDADNSGNDKDDSDDGNYDIVDDDDSSDDDDSDENSIYSENSTEIARPKMHERLRDRFTRDRGQFRIVNEFNLFHPESQNLNVGAMGVLLKKNLPRETPSNVILVSMDGDRMKMNATLCTRSANMQSVDKVLNLT